MKPFVAIAALVCGFAGAQARAETLDAPSAKVSYADLDLSRAHGRGVLEQRIAGAVRRVCPAQPLPGELRKYDVYRDCRQTAWSGVREQLGSIYGGRQTAGVLIVRASAD